MSRPIALPALDGHSTLGFLAALGTLRLVHDRADPDARLAFDDHTATAILHSTRLDGIDALIETLEAIVHRIPRDAVVPGTVDDFPLPLGTHLTDSTLIDDGEPMADDAETGDRPAPARSKSTGDPMLVHRDDLAALYRRFPGSPATTWLPALLTDLIAAAPDNPQTRTPKHKPNPTQKATKKKVARSLYLAPSGNQNLRTLFSKPLDAIRQDPRLLREALTGWHRVPGTTGEYFDHRALNSAADHPLGKTGLELGVPGATWLAVMALPLLPVTGDGTRVHAPLWHYIPGRKQPVMIWPLWRQPLDLHATRALLHHPALRPSIDNGRLTANPRRYQPLGVFQLHAAHRHVVPGRTFDGVLVPVSITPTA